MVTATAGSRFKELRAALLARSDLTGLNWSREWSRVADEWVAGLFDAAVAAAGRGRDKGMALMAVGGYGRGSLAPGSDLDLLLLHDGRSRHVRDVANTIWYPIWDSGQPLDHSVRTVKEARTAMDSDIKVALGLLDARLVAGDAGLAAALADKTSEQWTAHTVQWLSDLSVTTRERHDRFGDLAFLLEPDLKEARGGLRDIHLLQTISKVTPVLADVLGSRTLAWAERTLMSVRVELQRPTASPGTVLLLQDQDMVAAALGMEDADALMASVADAARAIAWASEDGWRRVGKWVAATEARGSRFGSRRGGRPDDEEDLALEPGIVLRGGEVWLGPGVDPAADPTLALRVAAASAEQDHPISHATLERLAARTLPPDDTWPPAVRQALVRLLGAGRPAIAAIEALDQQNVWLRYVPEWAPVRNRPQRNAYHRFTVDRHLLEAVALASGMQSSVNRPDLLLLGALLHDIGKGQGGDHTDLGIAIVGKLGPRIGLPEDDVAKLQQLVRHHLLLPDAATRRDLDDPGTAQAVAAAVGDHDTLELLAALTEADSQATGPAAWGTWKAGLVSRLVDQVSEILEGRPPPDTGRAALTPAEHDLLSSGQLSVLADHRPTGRPASEPCTVRVAAPDRAGLLSAVAGVLTLSGANVRSATTISDPESAMALLRFEVTAAFDELPSWDKVRSDVQAALDGRLDVVRRLEEREARYRRFSPSIAAHTPDVKVLFDDRSASSTIVEVRAPDRGPVLFRVTRALSMSGVVITCALVSTLGAEAIDVFYIHTGAGDRVNDPAHQASIRVAVMAELHPAARRREAKGKGQPPRI